MNTSEKEKMKALIEAKKKGKPQPFPDRQDVYRANGEKRKGIKQHKQGGLFDK